MARWTVEDEETGVNMLIQNKPYSEISSKLNRSQSAMINHFNFDFWMKYYRKKALKLWSSFDGNRCTSDDNEIDIHNLKQGQIVYIDIDALKDTMICTIDDLCFVGWIKAEVLAKKKQIKIWNETTRYFTYSSVVNHDYRVLNFELKHLNKLIFLNAISLDGSNLFYCDFWGNVIHSAINYGSFRDEVDVEYVIKCECKKVMTSKYINIKKIIDAIECNKCNKKCKRGDIYHCSDTKNAIHSQHFNLCSACAETQIRAQHCTMMHLPFDNFDINIIENELSLSRSSIDEDAQLQLALQISAEEAKHNNNNAANDVPQRKLHKSGNSNEEMVAQQKIWRTLSQYNESQDFELQKALKLSSEEAIHNNNNNKQNTSGKRSKISVEEAEPTANIQNGNSNQSITNKSIQNRQALLHDSSNIPKPSDHDMKTHKISKSKIDENTNSNITNCNTNSNNTDNTSIIQTKDKGETLYNIETIHRDKTKDKERYEEREQVQIVRKPIEAQKNRSKRVFDEMEYKEDEIGNNEPKIKRRRIDNMQAVLTEKDKLKLWLTKQCELPDYYDVFIVNGVDTMEIVKLVSINVLEKMNIKIGHQLKIMHEINKLKQQ